ncbi:glycoside hydrolase family 9 protein [Melioribacteraceae bacterium 4301-Me]|uniref:glycoside hydrolase family 9 protein n=1 Tax=Pyranulibacter aquaticus TaxID=3163344 RepID=UPI003599C0AF
MVPNIKTIILIITQVILISQSAPIIYAQCALKENTNLVINSDFNFGLQGWMLQKGTYACSDTSLSKVSYNGNAIKITVNNNYLSCTQQYNWRTFIRGAMNGSLVQGRPYVLTFRVRTNSTQPVNFEAAVRKASPQWNWIIAFNKLDIVATNQWQQYCKIHFYNDVTTSNIEVAFFFGEVTDGTEIWIDDVYVGEPAGYVEEHFIRTNQVGYIIGYSKEARSVDPCNQFSVKDVSTGNTVFTGNCLEFGPYPDLLPGNPCISVRDTIWGLDFSDFNIPGNYYILTDKGYISHPFTISNDIYNQLRKDALKFFYYQRCGHATMSQYAGNLAHPACHLQDANADVRDTLFNPIGFKDVLGGWHDAGDYVKYTFNNALTTAFLAKSYLENPEAFDDQNDISESGNGIPDIVDELAYNTKFLLKMQDTNINSSSFGGVHSKVSTAQWNVYSLPHTELQTRYLTPITTISTAGFIAAMCYLYRVFSTIPYYQNLAQQTAVAANNAWGYLQSHSQYTLDLVNTPKGSYIKTAEYEQYPDIDERLWAAAEMFRTFNNISAKNFFETNYTYCNNVFLDPGYYSHYHLDGSCPSMPYHRHNVWIGFLSYLEAANPDYIIKSQLMNWLISQADTIRSRTNKEFFSFNPRTWDNCPSFLNNAPILKKAFELTGDSRYLNTIVKNVDYILGKNIVDYSFVTGYGCKFPVNINHLQTKNDAYMDVMPGALVGGPMGNSTIGAKSIPLYSTDTNDPDYLFSIYFEPCTIWPKRYADLPYNPFQNEPAIDFNARLVYALYSLVPSISTGISESIFFTETFRLEQNYPNPFNPSTTIPFSLSQRENVTLKVFDVLGREVATLVDRELNAGKHSVNFNAEGIPSGVYFAQMKAGNAVQRIKMVVVK